MVILTYFYRYFHYFFVVIDKNGYSFFRAIGIISIPYFVL